MRYIIALLLTLSLVGCTEVKDVTPTQVPASGGQQVAATRAPDVPPTATVSPKVIGQPTILESRGQRFSITVNAVIDPSPSTNQFNTPKGRWVVVDWTIKNEGTANVDISTSYLKLLTADSFEVDRGNHAGHKTPELDYGSGTLGPGQSTRGFIAYDVPTGAKVTAAIYHPLGSPQLPIATLP